MSLIRDVLTQSEGDCSLKGTILHLKDTSVDIFSLWLYKEEHWHEFSKKLEKRSRPPAMKIILPNSASAMEIHWVNLNQSLPLSLILPQGCLKWGKIGGKGVYAHCLALLVEEQDINLIKKHICNQHD